MKTYKIFVNGMYVGTQDFTRSEVTAIESDQDIKLIEKQKGAGKMPKYYVSYNDYFGYCVVEEINGTGKIVFTGSIEKCNQKCIELNAEAINMIQPKRSDLGASAVGRSPGSDDGRPKKAARLPSTAATNQKRKATALYHSQKGKENEKIITQRNLQNGRNDGRHQIRM